jgi:hypothetical protein
MLCFPIPPNEDERLAELRRLRFSEWGVSVALNELCAVASKSLGTPIAHLSLVGEKEQIFAAKIGLDAGRTSRQVAFCAHTIMKSGPLIIGNAEQDPRFSDNPLVKGEPGIKSYLGIPLETSPGLRIGALCAADRKPRNFGESDVRTLESLGQIAVSIVNHHRMTLELGEQMKSAIALQKDMLPSPARIAQIEAYCPVDLAAHYQARDGIGGDIWGIEATAPQRLLVYVADFTGHGVAAALNTARFHSFVHVSCERTDRPASLLRRLNRRLNEVLPSGQFATMFCATMDFKSESIECASAGAPPQFYRQSMGAGFEIIGKPSLPLGVIRDVAYETETLPFLPGGGLVLYTDGLIETPKPPRNIWTSDSLREFLCDAGKTQNSSQICRSILGKLGSEPAMRIDDDIALIVAQRASGPFEAVIDYEV